MVEYKKNLNGFPKAGGAMKRIKKIISACLLMALPWTGMAMERAYFHGDKNLPMVLNTGGIYTDGSSGVFMDLSSIELEDIFKNGMAVKADFLHIENGVTNVSTEHFRMADDSRAWIRMEDGWHIVTSESSYAERAAVDLIRDDMGSESKRGKYMSRITAIWDAKVKAHELKREAEEKAKKPNPKEEGKSEENKDIPEDPGVELGRVEPDNILKGDGKMTVKKSSDSAKDKKISKKSEKTEKKGNIPLEGDGTVPAKERAALEPASIKIKGYVQKEEDAEKNKKGKKEDGPEQVEIVIISHPIVEIISSGK